MHQQRLLFEYHPAFLLVCVGLGISYAFILYKSKYTWSVAVNRSLFVVRTILVSFVAIMLLGPVVKLTSNIIEKPEFVFLVDNSASIKEAVDPPTLNQVQQNIRNLRKTLTDQGYEVALWDLTDHETESLRFNGSESDLAGALRDVNGSYEGKNLAGIFLLSDGIYNSGSSPLYTALRVPVFAVGLGDTTERVDIVLKNVIFNKISYQGNKYPMRAEVVIEGLKNKDIKASLFQGGKLLASQVKNSGSNLLLDFDFQLDATEKGLQRIDVVVDPTPEEKNKKNNSATAFVEVVEGKKKILLIAPAPHPDIKAIRAVIEKNSNYEFFLHVPGVTEADPGILLPGKADLIIFHQALDAQGKTAALFSKLKSSNSARLLMLGTGSNFRSLQAEDVPLNFERTGQWDEVTPIINPGFRDFTFAENTNRVFSKYPPASVPFGKFSFPGNASILLYQQIGSVTTERPMLLTFDENGKKTGVLIAEGIWRWRLNEYSESEKTEVFDEVFSKLIQYLSTREDKRKFKCFPLQNEFTDTAPVIFESQVYNDLFEQIYGNKIDLTIRDEHGKTISYNYITSPGGTRYRIGGLTEGLYHFTGSTSINGKREDVKGEFLIRASNIESQNLTADFGLLRKLADNTGGKFYSAATMTRLGSEISKTGAKGLIHSEDSFNPLINLKWVFFFILALACFEWFTRKYLGSI